MAKFLNLIIRKFFDKHHINMISTWYQHHFSTSSLYYVMVT